MRLGSTGPEDGTCDTNESVHSPRNAPHHLATPGPSVGGGGVSSGGALNTTSFYERKLHTLALTPNLGGDTVKGGSPYPSPRPWRELYKLDVWLTSTYLYWCDLLSRSDIGAVIGYTQFSAIGNHACVKFHIRVSGTPLPLTGSCIVVPQLWPKAIATTPVSRSKLCRVSCQAISILQPSTTEKDGSTFPGLGA